MPLILVRNDITRMRVDAIVNSANKSLRGGGGTDGAIHRAAGAGLLEECKKLGGCAVGEAKITGAYALPAKYVIHTVGPKWMGGIFGEKKKLADCYRNSLEIAYGYGCETVAFPLISSGTYRFPKKDALNIATDTIRAFLDEYEMTVYLVVFDKESVSIGKDKYPGLRQFIDDRYSEASHIERRRTDDEEETVVIYSAPDEMIDECDDYDCDGDGMNPLSSMEWDVSYNASQMHPAPMASVPVGIQEDLSYPEPADTYGKKEKKQKEKKPKEKKVKEKRSGYGKRGTFINPPGASAPYSGGFGASSCEYKAEKPKAKKKAEKKQKNVNDASYAQIGTPSPLDRGIVGGYPTISIGDSKANTAALDDDGAVRPVYREERSAMPGASSTNQSAPSERYGTDGCPKPKLLDHRLSTFALNENRPGKSDDSEAVVKREYPRTGRPAVAENVQAVEKDSTVVTESFTEYFDKEMSESEMSESEVLKNANIDTRLFNKITQPKVPVMSLADKLRHLDESFSDMLKRKVDEAGITDVMCYKRANLDRRLYNKIINDRNYRPSKPTVLALSVALRLSIEETRDFLARAGFAFSGASKFDIIIEYFITIGVYDIFEINNVLFEYDQCLLGNVA